MDFIKSAVASAISKGSSFGYSFDDRVDCDSSLWTLHNSTKREDGSKCSVFSFDSVANKSRLPLARNALRKLRTLRHPGVIKVLDTIETDTYIYIATERVTPLSWHVRRKSLSPETTKWGLHSIAKTVQFINNEATSVHGYIRSSTVFTTESGEWKLGGFDVLSSMKEDDAVIYTYATLVPDQGRFSPPEVVKVGWESIRKGPVHAVDAYMFGILVYEVFNGNYASTDQLTLPKQIPVGMQQQYKRLVAANPKIRVSVGGFLEQGLRSGGFFETPLIQLTDGIDNLGIKTDDEREHILSQLEDVSDDFPEDFFKMKVLPELAKSVEFGGGGPRVFSVIMKISKKLTDEEYEAQLTPVIVRLFSSPDRALRVCLLENLPQMIDHLPQKLVSNSIFPQIVLGFTDVAPLVREQTVKSVLVIVPKLSDRIINGELLRHLAKTANDEQPGIRTNTTICLGKIAKNLGQSSRAKVLIAAFARGLRDPFVHARNAALLSLAATADVYSDDDCATKILPGLCPSLIDKEKMIRDQANKTLDIFLARVRRHALTLPDTVLPAPTSGTSTPRPNQLPTMANASGDSGASWTGWAISSFTNKLTSVSGTMEPDAPNGASEEQRSSSMPPAAGGSRLAPPRSLGGPTSTKTTLSRPTSNTVFGPTSAPLTPDPAEDFDAGWGEAEDAWGASEETYDAFAPKPTTKDTPKTSFDDEGGEPDFEAWLNAKSQKPGVKKALPKGLAKTSRPTLAKSASSGAAATKKSALPSRTMIKKKEEPVTKAEEEDESWGDAWD